jgi:hypothetical protein
VEPTRGPRPPRRWSSAWGSTAATPTTAEGHLVVLTVAAVLSATFLFAIFSGVERRSGLATVLLWLFVVGVFGRTVLDVWRWLRATPEERARLRADVRPEQVQRAAEQGEPRGEPQGEPGTSQPLRQGTAPERAPSRRRRLALLVACSACCGLVTLVSARTSLAPATPVGWRIGFGVIAAVLCACWLALSFHVVRGLRSGH